MENFLLLSVYFSFPSPEKRQRGGGDGVGREAVKPGESSGYPKSVSFELEDECFQKQKQLNSNIILEKF